MSKRQAENVRRRTHARAVQREFAKMTPYVPEGYGLIARDFKTEPVTTSEATNALIRFRRYQMKTGTGGFIRTQYKS